MSTPARRGAFRGSSVPPPPPPPRVSNRMLARLLDVAAAFFGRVCHTLGAYFLRVLSTVMLVVGIVGTVVLEMTAYYYLGVLNLHPFLATLCYLPSLVALSVLREEMLSKGASAASGLGPPRESHAVAAAYLAMAAAFACSVAHPLYMRSENYISLRSMWTALGGTALFYYSLLISEVLYASALNLFHGREVDRLERHEEDVGPLLTPQTYASGKLQAFVPSAVVGAEGGATPEKMAEATKTENAAATEPLKSYY